MDGMQQPLAVTQCSFMPALARNCGVFTADLLRNSNADA
jgi:hypothetical protein